jgi:splicing factor 3B subunit 4
MLQVAPVVSVHLPKDRINQTHQGFGFVEFKDEKSADYAIQILNGVRLYGKPLRINKASLDKQRNLDIGAQLFVGNLDPLVDEKVLYDTFSVFGRLIGQPKIARDPDGVSRGFGFVSFDNFDSSDQALEAMNNQYLMNKPCQINYAFKRDGKGERHGDEAERLLAAQAKKNNYILPVVAPPQLSAGPTDGPPQQPIPTGPASFQIPTGPAALPPTGPRNRAPPTGPAAMSNGQPYNEGQPYPPQYGQYGPPQFDGPQYAPPYPAQYMGPPQFREEMPPPHFMNYGRPPPPGFAPGMVPPPPPGFGR